MCTNIIWTLNSYKNKHFQYYYLIHAIKVVRKNLVKMKKI